MKVIIHTDGGSRGNPGPAAAGIVIEDARGQLLLGQGIYLDTTTNNIAEYTGVVRGLEAAETLGADDVTLYSDSELLVKQLNGQYAVRSPNLKPLYQQAAALLRRFDRWQVVHVYREKNKHADQLVNDALDRRGDVAEKTEASAAPGLRLGVLISGGGRTLLNLWEAKRLGTLNIEIPVVISSRSTVAGVERAEKAGLHVEIVRKKDFPDVDAFSQKLEAVLTAHHVDLVIQAGWLCQWKIPAAFAWRVMNIHPALLPSFGGQGMWGHHVHEAVIKTGCKLSGCTVHYCTDEYDAGPIILQRCCPVEDNDDADSLAERVFEQECLAYPEAIQLFAEGRIKVREGRAVIKA